MRTEHFVYFTVVAREGSFSKAARKLFLSEPTLNKNITSFEGELGFKLFTRSKRRLALTPEGERFLPLAEKVSLTIDESIAAVRDIANRKELQLRINHVALDSDSVFTSALERLTEIMPSAEIAIYEADPKNYRERLLSSTRDTDIEFTVLNGTGSLPTSLEYRIIRPIGETIVVPECHPLANKQSVSFADLNGKRLVFSSSLPNEAHLQLLKDIENFMNGHIDCMFVNSISSALKLCDFHNHLMVKTSMYTVPEGYTAIPIETGFTSFLVALWRQENPNAVLNKFVALIDQALANGAHRE